MEPVLQGLKLDKWPLTNCSDGVGVAEFPEGMDAEVGRGAPRNWPAAFDCGGGAESREDCDELALSVFTEAT